MGSSSDLLELFLFLKLALFEFLLSNDNTFSCGKVECFWRNYFCWFLLEFLDLFRRHKECIVVFEYSDVGIDLALRVVVVPHTNIDFGTEAIGGLLVESFRIGIYFSKNFL